MSRVPSGVSIYRRMPDMSPRKVRGWVSRVPQRRILYTYTPVWGSGNPTRADCLRLSSLLEIPFQGGEGDSCLFDGSPPHGPRGGSALSLPGRSTAFRLRTQQCSRKHLLAPAELYRENSLSRTKEIKRVHHTRNWTHTHRRGL